MDKVAIVTGGGRGIGAAIAALLGRSGYSVAVNYAHDTKAAEQVVAAIEDAGGEAIAVKADVSNEADVLKLFRETDEQLGTVTALVNNAGIVNRTGPLAEITEETLSHLLAVNVTGPMLCAREAVRRMSTKRGGKGGGIVNISSAASRIGSPGVYVEYAASKGAIDSFTIGLAREVAQEGIRVNAVRSGPVQTDIFAVAPDQAEQLRLLVPMQRLGQPQEIAESVVWLLSDAASFVTGALLDVAGGR
jgi:NAD(P)-dependent dehydrogenase (short-subunit alcohol dehydrogenase family)